MPFSLFVLLLRLVLHHTPSTTPSTNSTPSPIKPVELGIDFQEKAPPFVDVVVGALVTAEVVVGIDDEVVEVEEVVGEGGKDNVGCADATLQNCCPRVSTVVTSLGQLANTQATISAG